MQGLIGVGLQPFHRTHPALVGKRVGVAMAQILSQLAHDQSSTGFDFPLIGIAGFLHVALWHPMGTEEHVGRGRIRTGAYVFGNQFCHRLEVSWVVEIAANTADW